MVQIRQPAAVIFPHIVGHTALMEQNAFELLKEPCQIQKDIKEKCGAQSDTWTGSCLQILPKK